MTPMLRRLAASSTVQCRTEVEHLTHGAPAIAKRFFSCACGLATASVLAGSPPSLQRTNGFESQAVEAGKATSLAAVASGEIPLSFQWKLDGRELPGQTDSRLDIAAARASDEGDYTVVVTNAYGAVTSDPIRLWVVPPSSRFVKANLTNSDSRLPYFYLLPANYDPARKYALLLWLHGAPTDETMIVAPSHASAAVHYLAESPELKVYASLKRQETDPTILVWPTRRAGDRRWTEEYLRSIGVLLDRIGSDFSIDTNRICLGAASEGVHAAWDLEAARPGFFAGAIFLSGWSGRGPPESLKDLPVWVFHAATDAVVDVRHSQMLVESLRRAGGIPRYTEFKTGTHASSILAAITTPAAVDWLATQRRGKASAQRPAK